MIQDRSTQLIGFFTLALLLGVGTGLAQPGSIDRTTASIYTANDFAEKSDGIAGGSISGRVLNDAVLSGETETVISRGIAGVRVILRAKEAGADPITGNRVSDAAGRFDFEALRPGRYTVEIDPMSIPARYRLQASTLTAIEVTPARRSNAELPIAAQRQIVGIVFIDNDGNGRYKPGKDEPVEGACISVDGQLAVSKADGTYVLRDLPAGRIGILVSWPKKNENTHVVLYLPPGPVTNRVVNISKDR